MSSLHNTLKGQKNGVPIWIMRQAGRYLPEYRALRQKTKSFMELCLTPDLCTEVTLQPLQRFDLDAAIIFSDILMIPYGLGYNVDFLENEGPHITGTMRESERFLERVAPVYEAIRHVRSALPKEKALFGFCGGPWTVAMYILEGKGSKDFAKAKVDAFQNPEKFDQFINQLTDVTILHLEEQINAGVDVIQIFESWASLLPVDQLKRWSITPIHKITTHIRKKFPDIPVIVFPRGVSHLWQHYYAPEGIISAISIDHQFIATPLPENPKMVFQGGIDPQILCAGGALLDEAIQKHLTFFKNHPYIANLSHGIIPSTPIAHVHQFIDRIRTWAPNA